VDSSKAGGVHGLDDEDEDILVHVVSFDEAYRMLEQGEIISSMPIIAIQWLALNKQKVRQQWSTLQTLR